MSTAFTQCYTVQDELKSFGLNVSKFDKNNTLFTRLYKSYVMCAFVCMCVLVFDLYCFQYVYILFVDKYLVIVFFC